MADDTQNPGDGRQEATQHSPTPKDVNGSRAKTFTQEEVDHIVNERLSRERSGKSDYEPRRPNMRRSFPQSVPVSLPDTASPIRACLSETTRSRSANTPKNS